MAKISVNVTGNHSEKASATHHTVQPSTTFSRKYVRRPDIAPRAARVAPAQRTAPTPVSAPKVAKPVVKPVSNPALSAKEAKDKAVKSALRSVATMERADEKAPKVEDVKSKKIKSKKKTRRLILALACSAATVGLLTLFINANMPDISVRVAAIQTGIEAKYPTYVPRGYSLSSVVSEKDGEITMRFKGEGDKTFDLTEQNSTWDSTALLNNFVKVTYAGDYITLREQGITIYLYGSEAAWVNGGIFYRISAHGESLTKEQIRNLVVSL